jgi:hypothetical protein
MAFRLTAEALRARSKKFSSRNIPISVLQQSKLFASCDQIENSPLRRGGLRERDFEIKNLCELCVLCGESLFSDLVAAVPRCELCVSAVKYQ